jgi:hypothetical protein
LAGLDALAGLAGVDAGCAQFFIERIDFLGGEAACLVTLSLSMPLSGHPVVGTDRTGSHAERRRRCSG